MIENFPPGERHGVHNNWAASHGRHPSFVLESESPVTKKKIPGRLETADLIDECAMRLEQGDRSLGLQLSLKVAYDGLREGRRMGDCVHVGRIVYLLAHPNPDDRGGRGLLALDAERDARLLREIAGAIRELR